MKYSVQIEGNKYIYIVDDESDSIMWLRLTESHN